MTRLLALLLFVSPFAAAQTVDRLPPPPEEPTVLFADPIAIEDGSVMREADAADMEHRAREGDAYAAFRLAAHYSSLDQHAHDHWMLRAAELGHPVAQYNMWFNLRESPQCADLREAKRWLELAAQQKEHSAVAKLPQFRIDVAARCGAE